MAETTHVDTLKINLLTQEQFDTATKDANQLYLITDEEEIGLATPTQDGLLSASDKDKLDKIAANANNYALPTASATQLGGVKVGGGLSITDGVLSATGGGVADAVEWANVQNKPDFKAVATTGSYNDLSDQPTIPAAQIQTDWNQTNTGSKDYIKNKPDSLPANGGNAATVGGHTVGVNVPADAKFTDTVYTHPANHPSTMITGLGDSATKNVGTTSGTVAAGDHIHDGIIEIWRW